MKSRKRSTASRRKSGGSTLIGLFLGLVLGVLLAGGVVWYLHRTPAPFSTKAQPPHPSAAAGTLQAPLVLPGKPGDTPPAPSDKPRFDFYTILPGNSEAISDPKSASTKTGEPKRADATKDKEGKDSALKEPVFLQTGSFQNASDADNQKAKLAMMGMEASVQQVMLQEKVWYRVRLGPFRKIEQVNAMRSELARQGIEAALVKKD